MFESISSVDDIPSANKNGMCYQLSLQYQMTHKNTKLCHGLATGQGAIEGIVYNHAWIERGNMVIDETIPIKVDKDFYYTMGKIKKTNVYHYTYKQMTEKVAEFGTYGPWEKKLLNNKY